MPMAAPVSVTPTLLLQAWQARRRPEWPPTFDACMADDFLRRLVRAEAVRLALAQRDDWPRPMHRAKPAHTTTTPAPLRAPAWRDLKRAAAGDASDD